MTSSVRYDRVTMRFTRREGPAVAGALPMTRSTVGLNEGRDALALRDDLAARDLRRVRNHRIEVLVGDPLRDERRRLVGLLAGLEETERAEDAVAGLDQVVAGETRRRDLCSALCDARSHAIG